MTSTAKTLALAVTKSLMIISITGAVAGGTPSNAICEKNAVDGCRSQCITTGSDDICRFNADCRSGLCATFSLLTSPKCVENTPENLHSASIAGSPTPPADFMPNKYIGMERWRNKVAVVTGVSAGIGFAVAKRLCTEGMIVVGTDIVETGLKELVEECPQANYQPFTADLRHEQNIISLFKFINETVGRVDVLVNNAGVAREMLFSDVSSEGLNSMLSLNIAAPVLCTRETLKIMAAKNIKTGYIMFTNSISGSSLLESRPGEHPSEHYLYSATKHALKVIREGLRRELRAKGSRIRVGEVSPASVITNIAESFIPRDRTDKQAIKQTFRMYENLSTLERLTPDDIAEAFVYMLQAPERMDINTILVENLPKIDE